MPKKIFSLLMLIVLMSGTIIAGSVVREFLGYTQENGIMLEWDSVEESEIAEYLMERNANGGNFSVIGKITPLGNEKHYTFFDESVFAKSAGRIYTYRIKIMNRDDSFTYSESVTVSLTLSAARETWGSIKAIFR